MSCIVQYISHDIHIAISGGCERTTKNIQVLGSGWAGYMRMRMLVLKVMLMRMLVLMMVMLIVMLTLC